MSVRGRNIKGMDVARIRSCVPAENRSSASVRSRTVVVPQKKEKTLYKNAKKSEPIKIRAQTHSNQSSTSTRRNQVSWIELELELSQNSAIANRVYVSILIGAVPMLARCF